MLQAKARHDNRKVEEIERDQAVLERAAKLEVNNGMDHKPDRSRAQDAGSRRSGERQRQQDP